MRHQVPSQEQTVQFSDSDDVCGPGCKCCGMTLVMLLGFFVIVAGLAITLYAFLLGSLDDDDNSWEDTMNHMKWIGPVLLMVGFAMMVGGCVCCYKTNKQHDLQRKSATRVTTSGTTISYAGTGFQGEPAYPLGVVNQPLNPPPTNVGYTPQAAQPMLRPSPQAERASPSAPVVPPPSYNEVVRYQ